MGKVGEPDIFPLPEEFISLEYRRGGISVCTLGSCAVLDLQVACHDGVTLVIRAFALWVSLGLELSLLLVTVRSRDLLSWSCELPIAVQCVMETIMNILSFFKAINSRLSIILPPGLSISQITITGGLFQKYFLYKWGYFQICSLYLLELSSPTLR